MGWSILFFDFQTRLELGEKWVSDRVSLIVFWLVACHMKL